MSSLTILGAVKCPHADGLHYAGLARMLAIPLYSPVEDLLQRGPCEPHAIHNATSIWREPLVGSGGVTWHADTRGKTPKAEIASGVVSRDESRGL